MWQILIVLQIAVSWSDRQLTFSLFRLLSARSDEAQTDLMWENIQGPGALRVWRRNLHGAMEIESSRKQKEGEIQFSSMWPTFVALYFMPGSVLGCRDTENRACPHSHVVHKVILSVEWGKSYRSFVYKMLWKLGAPNWALGGERGNSWRTCHPGVES